MMEVSYRMLSSYFASIVCSSIISTTLICSFLSTGSSSAESLSTFGSWFHFKDLSPSQSSWTRTIYRPYHQRYHGRSSSHRSAPFLFSFVSHKRARRRKSHQDQETMIRAVEDFLDHYSKEDNYWRWDYDAVLSKELVDIVPPFGFSSKYYDQVRRRRGHRGNDATIDTSTFVTAKNGRGSSWIRNRGEELPVARLFGTARMRHKPAWVKTHISISNHESGRTNSKPKSREARKSRVRSGCYKGCGYGFQKRGPITSAFVKPGRSKKLLFRETEDYDYGFDRMIRWRERERKDFGNTYLRHGKEVRWSEGDNLRDYGNVGCRASFFIAGQWFVSDAKEPTPVWVSNVAESIACRNYGNGQSYMSPTIPHLDIDVGTSSRERLLKTLQPRDGFVYLKTAKPPTSSPSVSAIPRVQLRQMLRKPRLPLRALTPKE